jgi:hypothetical protein
MRLEARASRPAANSTAERGSSTNITWISRQRVLSLAVTLAAGDLVIYCHLAW